MIEGIQMTAVTQKVVFARINRRRLERQDTFEGRSFREDMTALAGSHKTSFVELMPNGGTRSWFAADMAVEPGGDFMTGTLGFASLAQHRPFDREQWSWIKAQMEEVDAARADTIVPFAIDLRDGNRWLDFAPTARLRKGMFATGFQSVLNNAVSAMGLMPTEWEVDLVVSRARVDEWLSDHPLVHRLTRTIKFTNPGRDLDSDRAEMRALGARRKTEEFAASSRGVMNIDTEEFRMKLDGVETGDIELRLQSRGSQGAGDAIFNSNERADTAVVDSFGGDLIRGTDRVLAALRQYVADKMPAQRLWDD
jgi:hypothetical protein